MEKVEHFTLPNQQVKRVIAQSGCSNSKLIKLVGESFAKQLRKTDISKGKDEANQYVRPPPLAKSTCICSLVNL